MIASEEIARSIHAALRLARRDAGAIHEFEGGEGAFWRSFFAAVLVAPGYVMLVAAAGAGPPGEAGLGRMLAVETIAYVIGWTAFPLAAFHLARLIDRDDRYLRFITAYNWAQVIEMGVLLGAAFVVQILPPAAGTLVGLTAIGLILAYEWFIARVALEVGGLVAAGVILVGLIITLFLKALSAALLHVNLS